MQPSIQLPQHNHRHQMGPHRLKRHIDEKLGKYKTKINLKLKKIQINSNI